jgi:hypothetical protein
VKHLVVLSCVLLAVALVPTGRLSARAPDDGLVDRFLNQNGHQLRSFRARRTLEAATRGGRMSATIEAWTWLDESGRFDFRVTREDGSGLIRDRVLTRALETEQVSYARKGNGEAELTRANYIFGVPVLLAQDTAAVDIRPHVADPMRLNGTLEFSVSSGELVRLFGELSDTPSWWTRHVDVEQRYRRVAGVNVPVEFRSAADVRVVGASTFRMTYDYQMVNGRPVD